MYLTSLCSRALIRTHLREPSPSLRIGPTHIRSRRWGRCTSAPCSMLPPSSRLPAGVQPATGTRVAQLLTTTINNAYVCRFEVEGREHYVWARTPRLRVLLKLVAGSTTCSLTPQAPKLHWEWPRTNHVDLCPSLAGWYGVRAPDLRLGVSRERALACMPYLEALPP